MRIADRDEDASNRDEVGDTGQRRRRHWRWLLLFVVPPVLLGALPGGSGIVVGPLLQSATEDGITIVWETTDPASTEVVWGTSVEALRSTVVPGRRTRHRVRLEGLEPRTNYLYRVRSKDQFGRTFVSLQASFQAAVPAGDPFVVGIVGDTQDNPSVWGDISQRMHGERPSLVLHCGDLVEDGNDLHDWRQEFFRPARELLSHVPFHAVLGNHENDSEHWYRWFAPESGGHCYVLRYGDADFVMVDSNRDVRRGSVQFQWIDRVLRDSTAAWKFVLHHHPPFTSDDNDYGDTRRGPSSLGDQHLQGLAGLYHRHGVDIVFYGHVHGYERTWPLDGTGINTEDGVVYVQSGGGGGRLDGVASSRSWFTARVNPVHHYVSLALTADHLELRAYDQEGRLFDTMVRPSAASRRARQATLPTRDETPAAATDSSPKLHPTSAPGG